jgi:voltage-gated potassium channel Kch
MINYVLPTRPVSNTLTALAGGALVGATLLNTGYNEVDTVVTTGDSLMMPPATLGADVTVNMQNTAAGASAKIFAQANPFNGNVLDQFVLHGVVALTPGATGVVLLNGHVSNFICTTLGIWKQVADNA